MSGGRVVTVDAAASQIGTDKTVIAADGVESCAVSVTVKSTDQTDGEANGMAGLRANAVVLAVTPSTGVTITQPTGTANVNASVSGSFVSTNAATVSVTATILGVPIEGGATVVVGGGAPVDPPSGDPFYESGTTEATVRENANGFTWNGTGSRVVVAAVPAGRSGHGIRFRFGPDAAGSNSNAEQRFNLGRYVSHLWLQYDVFIPSNFIHRDDGGTLNNKFIWLWRDVYSDTAGGTWRISSEYNRNSDTESRIRAMTSRWDSNASSSNGYSPTGQATPFISPTGPLVIGAWNQLRMEFKAASGWGAENGIHRIWVNGTLYLETTTGKFWNFFEESPADCVLRNGYFFGASNSGFADETDFFIYAPKFYDTDPGWL